MVLSLRVSQLVGQSWDPGGLHNEQTLQVNFDVGDPEKKLVIATLMELTVEGESHTSSWMCPFHY